MKKIFDKLNKIMFVVGIVALVALVLILSYANGDVMEGIWGNISLICILLIFLYAIFVLVSAVLAIKEGFKKDKKELLKKFLSNVVWISIAYVIVFVLDYFHEAELPVTFSLGSLVFRVLLCTLAIFGGEYMLTDHSKKEKGELHF